MTPRVRILRRAQADIAELDRYLALEAPHRREQIVERILVAIERLAALPRIGPEPRDDRLRALGFRYLSVGDHIVFYKLAGRDVRVYRVLHGRREYSRLLR